MSRKNKNGNPLNDWITTMDRRDLIEMISKLCEFITKDAGENEYRGGIRPSNISRDAQGNISLGEGGMPQRNTWTAEQLEFISPEEFWNGEASARSDVYSLGLLLYYSLSGGKLPFQPDKEKLSAEERAKTVRRRMGGEPISAPDGAGKSLGAVVEKALSFRPEDRYTSVSDMPVVLQLCLKELDSVHTGKTIEKTEEELSDAENMMVGIISKAAEEAALSDEEKKAQEEAEATTKESTEEQDIEVEIVDLDEEAAEENATNIEAATEELTSEPADAEDESASEEAPEETAETVEEETETEASSAEEIPAETEELPKETSETAVEEEKEPVSEDKPEEEPVVTEDEISDKTILAAGATGAAVASAVAAAAAKTAQKEADGVSKAAKSDSKKKAAAATKPAVSYQTGKNPKKTNKNKKKKKRTLRAVLALLLLCALLVVAAFIINAIAKHRDQQADVTPTPAVTETVAPADTIEPVAPTAEETMEPAPSETELTVYKEDSSWTAAESKCESQGGHLAVIHNQDDLDRIIDLARRNNIRFIWIGCQRMSDGALHWVNGDSIDFYVWADGEPSLIGSGGESENYIMLWNTKEDLSGEWVYNDVGNNPALEYASTYSGRIGYVMETGN